MPPGYAPPKSAGPCSPAALSQHGLYPSTATGCRTAQLP
eukprot:CAMPEP_0202877134 /NCGR_PEP_ID=MMETSP1391-20130828/30178_1 /ASSEMBLY_ACC=CAM_ASM_000867 /TAXON_ID=1034604 /ORGANISM="Chlamydomonas leiostraca, Strain SAG 11-49" /LENGTH=38 /DNA_ID= /DNA_START= /DNA_END= /DNA_ORIENTATION=